MELIPSRSYFGEVVTLAGGVHVSSGAARFDGLVQFGGTTASFPALKRSSTELQVRLADDSAFAPIQADYLSLDGQAGGPVASGGAIRMQHGGSIVCRDAAGTGDLGVFGYVDDNALEIGAQQNGTTRIMSATLATPASLSNGHWWVDCVGTSPSRVCSIKVRDGGATRTIASVTY